MIVVYSNAGLANRMFHYALYKAIEAKGIDVYFDEKSYLPIPHLNIQLSYYFNFELNISIAAPIAASIL